MDFVGNCGCLYMIKKTQKQISIANPVARLATLYHIDYLSTFKTTLDAIFLMVVSQLCLYL